MLAPVPYLPIIAGIAPAILYQGAATCNESPPKMSKSCMKQQPNVKCKRAQIQARRGSCGTRATLPARTSCGRGQAEASCGVDTQYSQEIGFARIWGERTSRQQPPQHRRGLFPSLRTWTQESESSGPKGEHVPRLYLALLKSLK